MPKMKGKVARLYVDEQAIFTRSPELSYSQDIRTVDTSVYGDDFEKFESLTYNGKLDFSAFLDDVLRGPGDTADQLSDKFFQDQLIDPSTGKVVTSPALISTIIKDSPVAGDVGLFTQGYGGIQWTVPRDGITAIRMSMQETGAISRGLVLYLAEVTLDDTTTPSVNGSAVNLGDATKSLRIAMHCTKFVINAGTPTVTVKVESDDGNGFPSAIVRKTFTGLTDVGHEYSDQALDYADTAEDWHRVVITGSGTPAWNVTVGFVIIAETLISS